jgi:hypothetical protein
VAHAKEAESGHLGNCVELIERRGHRDARLGGFLEKILPILSQAALALWQVVVATSAKHNVDAFGYLLRGDELLRIAETHQPQTNDEWKQDAEIGVVRSHRVTECDEKEAGVASVMRLVTTRPVRIPCAAQRFKRQDSLLEGSNSVDHALRRTFFCAASKIVPQARPLGSTATKLRVRE